MYTANVPARLQTNIPAYVSPQMYTANVYPSKCRCFMQMFQTADVSCKYITSQTFLHTCPSSKHPCIFVTVDVFCKCVKSQVCPCKCVHSNLFHPELNTPIETNNDRCFGLFRHFWIWNLETLNQTMLNRSKDLQLVRIEELRRSTLHNGVTSKQSSSSRQQWGKPLTHEHDVQHCAIKWTTRSVVEKVPVKALNTSMRLYVCRYTHWIYVE